MIKHLAILLALSAATALHAANWTPETIDANQWTGICWSPELGIFCAVSGTGTSRVATSSDGITWAPHAAAEANYWVSICWAPSLGKFCAVSADGTHQVMTSTNGVNWVAQTAGATSFWRNVAWSPELGKFCAVASVATTYATMTSSDGITWSPSSSAPANPEGYAGLAWSPALGMFAAGGLDNGCRVMTSTNGVTWVPRTAATADDWLSITWSPKLGMFAAVADTSNTGFNHRVMTSTNGVDWVSQSPPFGDLESIAWSPELGIFCALDYSQPKRVLTSLDGVHWVNSLSAEQNFWYNIAWSPELSKFAGVAQDGLHRVQISNGQLPAITLDTVTGLRVTLDTSGKVIGVNLNGTDLSISGTGGFEYQDYWSAPGAWQTISGFLTPLANGVSMTSNIPRMTFSSTLIVTNGNITISGVLGKTITTNLPAGLRFRLPVVLDGWTWHDDIGTTRTISGSTRYENTVPTEAGSGLRSLYPFGTVSVSFNTYSISMGVPVAPSVNRISYYNSGFSVDISLALPGAFNFILFPADRAYGFRAAADHYYSTYPTTFARRQTFEAYYGYGFQNEDFNPVVHSIENATSSIPDASDFGEGFDCFRSLHGTAYATTWPTNSPIRPSDADFRAWLSVQPAGSLYPGSSAVQQLFMNPAGGVRYAAGIYNPIAHIWSLEPFVNQDSDITSGLTSQISTDIANYYSAYRLQWKPAIPSDFADGGLGSMQLDYDPSHLDLVGFSPTFGVGSLLPGIVNGLWDFNNSYLYPQSTTNSFILIGNTGSPDFLYAAPWLDVGMSEGSRTLADYRFYRTLSPYKIWRNYTTIGTSGTNVYTLPDFLAELQNCLTFGIYPSLASTTVGSMTETFRPYYRLYIPAIEEESQSGWQVVNYASSDNGAMVERFGSYTGTNLVFSVANTNSSSITSTVTFNTTGLAIPGGVTWAAQDLVSLAYVPVSGNTFSVSLTNGQTRAFSLLNTNNVWQRKVIIAQAYLDRIQRTFTNDLVSADNVRIATLRATLSEITSNATLDSYQPTINPMITAVQYGMATAAQSDLSKLIVRIRTVLGYPTPSISGGSSVVILGTVRINNLVIQ